MSDLILNHNLYTEKNASATGEVFTKAITGTVSAALVAATDGSGPLLTRYTVSITSTPSRLENLLGATVTIAAMADAVNNGDFIVERVDVTNNYIWCYNKKGITATVQSGTLAATNAYMGVHVVSPGTGGSVAADIEGVVAHDAAVGSTNPVLISGEAKTYDGAALPNPVGTEGDNTRVATTLSGVQYTMPVTQDGARTAIVIDDAAQTATPGMINVGGEFRTAATTYTDGDATILQTDVNGRLLVSMDLIDYVDDAAFVVATDKLMAIGAMADETTPDSVDEGDIGIPRMTLTRKLYTASDQSHDDAATAYANMSGSEAKTFDGVALPNPVGVEADIVRNAASLSGVQYIMPVNQDGSKTLLQTEDVAHVSGDLGVQLLAVRTDVMATLADTTGDYAPLQLNASGQLRVDAAVTLNDFADDSAFAVGTDMVIATGFLADETTPDPVDEGDIGIARMTLTRKQINASEFLEDTAHVTADYGTQVLAVRNDTLDAIAGTDGDYAPLQVNAAGALYVDTSQSNDMATHDSVVIADGPQTMAEAKDFDGVALPIAGTMLEGDATRIAASLYGIQYVMPVNEDGSKTPIATDDSALVATPDVFSVGCEYRAAATTYTDGDSTILQSDVNGRLLVTPQTTYTAVALVDATPQNFTAAWAALGAEIDMRGNNQLTLYGVLDINDSLNARIRVVGRHTSGGTNYPFMIESVIASDIKVESEYIEFNTDADQNAILKFNTDGVPFVLVQIQAGTVGAAPGNFTSVNQTRAVR